MVSEITSLFKMLPGIMAKEKKKKKENDRCALFVTLSVADQDDNGERTSFF